AEQLAGLVGDELGRGAQTPVVADELEGNGEIFELGGFELGGFGFGGFGFGGFGFGGFGRGLGDFGLGGFGRGRCPAARLGGELGPGLLPALEGGGIRRDVDRLHAVVVLVDGGHARRAAVAALPRPSAGSSAPASCRGSTAAGSAAT